MIWNVLHIKNKWVRAPVTWVAAVAAILILAATAIAGVIFYAIAGAYERVRDEFEEAISSRDWMEDFVIPVWRAGTLQDPR